MNTERTRLRRYPDRGVQEITHIHAILDEAFVCHVAFVADDQPFVLPTIYGRENDELYLHGAKDGRLMAALAQGQPLCVTITLIDGLVLARSAAKSSVNYRCVMVLGPGRAVMDRTEKMKALRCITNHALPRRWAEVRPPSDEEFDGTSVVAIRLNEFSAKVRVGQPKDLEGDLDRRTWAGVVPLRLQPGTPIPAPGLPQGIEPVDPLRFLRATS